MVETRISRHAVKFLKFRDRLLTETIWEVTRIVKPEVDPV